MTTGSPVASFVSGPATADTNARRFPSGDHASRSPAPGSGWLVPSTGATNTGFVPSGADTTTPDLSPSRPKYAIAFPSGDHRGEDAGPPFPSRFRSPDASVRIHTSDAGRPGRSRTDTP